LSASGHFVGLPNFEKIWSRRHLHVAVWNPHLNGRRHVYFKLVLASGSRWGCSSISKARPLPVRSSSLPFIISDRAVDLGLELDFRTNPSRHQLILFKAPG